MKTRFVPVCLALNLALTAAAWAADPALGSLLACRSIQDTAARLACFDRESAAIASATSRSSALTQNSSGGVAPPSAPAAPAAAPSVAGPSPSATPSEAAAAVSAPAATNASSAANASTPAALDPVATFGLPAQAIAARENAAGLRKKDLQSITAHIARMSSGSSGRMVFDLDNHQAWQQIGNEGDLMAKPGDEVKIWRGMLGSFWLQASTGRGCKVTRLE